MSVTKRNGKYYAKFQVNGERRNRLCEGATTKAEADKMEMAFRYKLLQEQNGVIPREDKHVKLSLLFMTALEQAEEKKSYKQIKSRILLMKEYFKNVTYAKDLKPIDVEKYKKRLLEQGLTKTTVNRYLEILSRAFNIAIDNDWLKTNPVKSSAKYQEKNYTVRYLKEDEEKRLFDVLPKHLARIVMFALDTGLRKANLLDLRWEQINFDFKIIEVLENKGNKHLKIPMTKKVLNYLKSVPMDMRKGYVFINPYTNKKYTDIRRPWHTALKKANVLNFRFHDLRHTVGTRLALKNKPVTAIQKFLGHTDIKTTMRYIHVSDQELRALADVLDSF